MKIINLVVRIVFLLLAVALVTAPHKALAQIITPVTPGAGNAVTGTQDNNNYGPTNGSWHLSFGGSLTRQSEAGTISNQPDFTAGISHYITNRLDIGANFSDKVVDNTAHDGVSATSAYNGIISLRPRYNYVLTQKQSVVPYVDGEFGYAFGSGAGGIEYGGGLGVNYRIKKTGSIYFEGRLQDYRASGALRHDLEFNFGYRQSIGGGKAAGK